VSVREKEPLVKRVKVAVLSLFLLIIALSAVAGVTGLWKGWPGLSDREAAADLSAGTRPIAAPSPKAAEPATILVLGTGLAGLALYAKLKRAK
jgi:hypothetical protein